ncbi:hypothetical protein PCANC_06896 [Puccinia coronata f. sp. avenae]|uniref:Uncharacterized protein n=1 Tax=Puccinia coronata f. sp. avenae TaxID=200324 RepID=A0A2N5VH47_9BASI|nr:hypothetical protein PCANC_06896 [Puccinia coronata f. sp. avenae]
MGHSNFAVKPGQPAECVCAMSLQLSIPMLFAALTLSFALFVFAANRFISPLSEYGSKRAYRLTAADHLKRRGSF